MSKIDLKKCNEPPVYSYFLSYISEIINRHVKPPAKLPRTGDAPTTSAATTSTKILETPQPATNPTAPPMDLELKLKIGRLDPRPIVADVAVNIEPQETLPHQVYDVINGLVNQDLVLDVD